MTKEEALDQLRNLISNDDTEAAHMQADRILTKLLGQLGYEDVVRAWEKIPKRYA